jgi:hypothetical protein
MCDGPKKQTMDGEDADEVVFRANEVEIVGGPGLAGEDGEHFR